MHYMLFVIKLAEEKKYLLLYTLQQKKLCTLKIAVFFQPWQKSHRNKLLLEVHGTNHMINQKWKV